MAEEIQRNTLAVNAGFQRLAAGAEQGGKGFEAFNRGANSAAHASTGVRRELIVLAHEMAMGNYTRLSGSLMVMAERMGNAGVAGKILSAVMSPLGLAFIAVAGAVALVTIDLVQAAQRMKDFTQASEAGGQRAGVSAAGFVSMAKAIERSTGSTFKDAQIALTELAKGGQVSGQSFIRAGEDAIEFARISHTSADQVAGEFSKMGDDVAGFAAKWSKEHGGITADTMRLIEQLQREGRTAEAQDAFFSGYGQFLDKTTGKVQTLTDALGRLWESMGSRRTAPVFQMRSEQPQIEAQKRAKDQKDAADAKAADAAGKVARANAAAVAGQAEWNKATLEASSNAKQLGAALDELKVKYDVQVAGAGGNTAVKQKLAADYAAQAAELRKEYADKPAKKPKGMASEGQDEETQLSNLLAQEKNWYADREQITYDFWSKKVAAGHKGTALQEEDERRMNQAAMELDKAHYAAMLETDRVAIDEAKDSPGKLAAAWTTYLSLIASKQGAQSAFYIEQVHRQTEALDELKKKQGEHAAEEEVKQGEYTVKNDEKSTENQVKGLETQAVGVKDQGQDGMISRKQETAQLIAIVNQETAVEAAGADKALADKVASYQKAIAAAQGNEEEINKLNDQMVAAGWSHMQTLVNDQQKAADQIVKIQDDAAKKTAEVWKQNVSTIVDDFGSGFLSMARGTGTFQQMMNKVAESVENIFVQSIEKQVTATILGNNQKVASTAASSTQQAALQTAGATQGLLATLVANEKQITANAAAAASAAYKAMAGIPIIGPALGAAAAAATFTAVEAYGQFASASGGYDIGNENPMVQAHAKEMVLPASLSEGFRKIISNQGGGPAGGGVGGSRGAGGGGMNVNISALDSRSVSRMMDSPKTVSSAKRAFSRHG
jgi:hypothetical protein